MPEGHTLHRLAAALAEAFGGRAVEVSSPQGRFAEAAQLVNGAVLVGAEAWGKHLFVSFEDDRYVHVHLGLYGRFDISHGPPLPPVGQVRLRIVSTRNLAYADLRGATTCDLVTDAQRAEVIDRLGPDPLRPEADPERAWRRIHRSRSPIGTLLMDQSVLAGVGNVYRAEVLFRHRVHPLRPGDTLQRRRFEAMWHDLVELMAYGVRTGRIDTLRASHSTGCGADEQGRDDRARGVYVYRRQGQPCLVCGSRVRTEVLAARNLFWCGRCQPKFRSRAQGR